MSRRPSILLVGQTPPPFHGQAVATKILFDHDWPGLKVLRLRMAYSSGEADVGKFGISKLFHLMALIVQSWWILLRNRPCFIYYPPASPNLVPVLRDIVYLFAVRPFSKGIILHYHAGGLPAYVASLNPFLRVLARCAYGRAKASIEISKSEIGPGVEFVAEQKFHVANGLDVPGVNSDPGTSPDKLPFRILYMAGLRKTKGVMDLVHTASALKARRMDFMLDVAGPWQEEDTRRRFEAAVQEANVADSIVVHGRITGDKKWMLYKEASLFFFPSYYESENFPLVLIEAMAFGLPVVATRWRGIPQMVVEGETGLLCDVSSIDQFADAIEAVMTDRKKNQAMSLAAEARYVSKYTQGAFLTGMREVFDAVIGKEEGHP
ncbi:MAG: glycosyltransferase family 4 protein [Verrucomicrobiota bacterium]|nr:glycosyltransferase family 4 protein [Verrucomicrobiota bacterium]